MTFHSLQSLFLQPGCSLRSLFVYRKQRNIIASGCSGREISNDECVSLSAYRPISTLDLHSAEGAAVSHDAAVPI